MSKIMSVFEKLNLLEKTDEETNSNSEGDNVNVQEEIESKSIEDGHNENKLKYSETNADGQHIENSNSQNENFEKKDFKKNTKVTIEEIYSSANIENSNVNTIFMLGNFINALPESLPYEVRKKSLISIINSSNTDLKKLLSDGARRLDVLYQFSNDFGESTTDIIEEYKQKIAELKKQISDYEEQISVNENLLKEQNNMIKYETEKINNIIDFFDNGDK